MNKFVVNISLMMCFFFLGVMPVNAENIKTKKVVYKVQPFNLGDVRLLDGPFRNAMELDAKWLLKLDVDRLLSGFYSEAGLKPKKKKYGGWEQNLSGHTLGHYLSAISMMYAATGDERFNERIKYIVTELDTCQKANGNGYVGAVPNGKKIFFEISKGKIRSQGFDLNGGWVPWYNIHKLFAGLVDVYNYTGNKQAKKVLIKLSDWADKLLENLSDGQMQKMLVCEHGGMNEVFADVYAISGNPKHLKLAVRFNHQSVLEPLAAGRDELVGQHANTQIPKVIGVMREFELTGNTTYFHTADFFWSTVVKHHSYVIGGNSESEHFGRPGHIFDRITAMTCENCNTYNMLKLTEHLYLFDPSVEKADYYERAMYNQILASQNPQTGMVNYFATLGPGTSRKFCSPENDFWCCVGTGLENHAKYGKTIYYKENNNLIINLFVASELTWKEKGLRLVQQTSYPETDNTTIKLELKKPQKFAIKIRYPSWAVDGCSVTVNGIQQQITTTPGSYITFDGKWKTGDEIIVQFPMRLHSENAAGSDKVKAYLYGPVVLAANLGETEWKKPYPVIVSESTNPSDFIKPAASVPLTFVTEKAQPENVELIPYYKTSTNKMMVYFDVFTPDEWEKQKDSYLSSKNAEVKLVENTVDSIRLGEMQPERDHGFEGENTTPGTFMDRKHRQAKNGWFSFKMKVLPDMPMKLVCTYWGNLGHGHSFDILVDNELISTVIIHWWGDKFVDKVYSIPENLTRGKTEITVKFKSVPDQTAGPVYECKTLK